MSNDIARIYRIKIELTVMEAGDTEGETLYTAV